ncbi:MAG: M23 family metallopeptidase [Kitasatospora sp.]|nr:M23 family metallopeptidase [Kitasatospora sp.]
MASYRRGPEAPYDSYEPGYDDGYDGPLDDWDPADDDVRPTKGGRRRAAKQSRGSMARSGAVLGVGVIAAVGAGSMAHAQSKPPVAISLPDMGPVDNVAHSISSNMPRAKSLPGVGDLLPGDDAPAPGTHTTTPFTQAGLTSTEVASGQQNAGETLRARIMQQAEQQQQAADDAERATAEKAAAAKAAKEAADAKAEVAKKKKAAEEAARKKAEEAARKKAEAERLAKLAASYLTPVQNFTLTASFGEVSSHWQTTHTGQDFAAPTGTPLRAIHTATVKEAGWAGSYGYRTVLQLDDGTELWYCHQSQISVSVGQKVTTGDVIGRVGATGNVTGPHLHLEVRPGGGDPVDPMPWLRNHGLPL